MSHHCASASSCHSEGANGGGDDERASSGVCAEGLEMEEVEKGNGCRGTWLAGRMSDGFQIREKNGTALVSYGSSSSDAARARDRIAHTPPLQAHVRISVKKAEQQPLAIIVARARYPSFPKPTRTTWMSPFGTRRSRVLLSAKMGVRPTRCRRSPYALPARGCTSTGTTASADGGDVTDPSTFKLRLIPFGLRPGEGRIDVGVASS
ncbi:hypothetical protein DFH08DRAFT_798994 [Mycena albidolilacea]|uniref:Uncharacterized protein n=1 Tax=Mycena albidolilacea TaxID=1033008 RepID=A0AAD7F4A0_9AGAR|nr:hypothetical protein DFH08DRAFT_798994 [Mycena albidolilacea]